MVPVGGNRAIRVAQWNVELPAIKPDLEVLRILLSEPERRYQRWEAFTGERALHALTGAAFSEGSSGEAMSQPWAI